MKGHPNIAIDPSWLDRFLPESQLSRGNVGEILTTRLALSVALILAAIGVSSLICFPPAIMGPAGWIGTIVVVLVGATVPFRVRRGASVARCVQQLMASMVIVLTIVNAQQGGTVSPAIMWLALFPYLAFVLGGWRSAVIVGALAVTCVGVLLAGALMNIFPEQKANLHPAVIGAVIVCMNGTILMVVARASSRIRSAVEQDLHRANQGLSSEVSNHRKTRDRLEVTHRELVDVARIAGAAEVATGILHNLGNALTAVNVCAGLADTEAAGMDLDRLERVADFVSTPEDDRAARYIHAIRRDLDMRRSRLRDEVGALRNAVEHASAIVATQQRHAVRTSVAERITLQEFVCDAVTLSTSSGTSNVRVDVACSDVPDIIADRHRLMQIITNLLTNAHDAVSSATSPAIRVHGRLHDDRLEVRVTDNGIGMDRDTVRAVFAHGFTTKPTGHGFGLHASALAAKELGGKLTVDSPGPGKGAMFCLVIPVSYATTNVTAYQATAS